MQTDKYYLCKDLIGNIDSLTSSAKQTIDSIEAYNENSKTGATAKFSIYANGNTTSTALDADETNIVTAIILESYATAIKESRDRIVEIIDKDYRTILNEIGKLRRKAAEEVIIEKKIEQIFPYQGEPPHPQKRTQV